ncbi:MAG: hypothetical protein ABIA04_00355 [Pseudomonadota bacterium]
MNKKKIALFLSLIILSSSWLFSQTPDPGSTVVSKGISPGEQENLAAFLSVVFYKATTGEDFDAEEYYKPIKDQIQSLKAETESQKVQNPLLNDLIIKWERVIDYFWSEGIYFGGADLITEYAKASRHEQKRLIEKFDFFLKIKETLEDPVKRAAILKVINTDSVITFLSIGKIQWLYKALGEVNAGLANPEELYDKAEGVFIDRVSFSDFLRQAQEVKTIDDLENLKNSMLAEAYKPQEIIEVFESIRQNFDIDSPIRNVLDGIIHSTKQNQRKLYSNLHHLSKDPVQMLKGVYQDMYQHGEDLHVDLAIWHLSDILDFVDYRTWDAVKHGSIEVFLKSYVIAWLKVMTTASYAKSQAAQNKLHDVFVNKRTGTDAKIGVLYAGLIRQAYIMETTELRAKFLARYLNTKNPEAQIRLAWVNSEDLVRDPTPNIIQLPRTEDICLHEIDPRTLAATMTIDESGRDVEFRTRNPRVEQAKTKLESRGAGYGKEKPGEVRK